MAISAAGFGFIVLVAVYLPYASIRSYRRIKQHATKLTLGLFAINAMVSHLLMTAIALAVASVEGVSLFPRPNLGWINVGYALAFLVPTLATLPMRWNLRSREEKQKTLWRIPKCAPDFFPWTAVSLSAGISEEILYRGVLFQLWSRLLGSFWPASMICSISFALAHGYQGWRSVAVIMPMALASHLLVRATGDLYTAMAIHFVYDLLAGVLFRQLAKKEGLLPEMKNEEGPADCATTRPHLT